MITDTRKASSDDHGLRGDGMSCEHCVNAVTIELNGLDGSPP